MTRPLARTRAWMAPRPPVGAVHARSKPTRRSSPRRSTWLGGRHRRAVDGRRRPARRRVEGDDLPPVVLEGGARPRRPAQCHAAVRRCRHGHAERRPRPVRRRAHPPVRRRTDERRAPAPHRGQLPRRDDPFLARRLHPGSPSPAPHDPHAWRSTAASSPTTPTSTSRSTCSSGRSSTGGCSATTRSTTRFAARLRAIVFPQSA